jgi:uncharacterized Zn finger protein
MKCKKCHNQVEVVIKKKNLKEGDIVYECKKCGHVKKKIKEILFRTCENCKEKVELKSQIGDVFEGVTTYRCTNCGFKKSKKVKGKSIKKSNEIILKNQTRMGNY